MNDVRPALAGTLLLLVLLEVAWAAWRLPRAYDARETLCNFAIALVNGWLKPAGIAWQLLVLEWIPWRPMAPLPADWPVFVLTFVATDLAYYWFHRCSHTWPWLWAVHQVHHSSPWMNLTTALRLSWIGKFVAPLFFAPLVLLGLPPLFVALSLALGLLFQFPLHTQAVPSLGVFEGRLLNTPSAHRVHHGANAPYLNRNFAGVFILWDVLFGTWQPEREPVRFGLTTGFPGHNPLRVQFQPLWELVRGGRGRRRNGARIHTKRPQGTEADGGTRGGGRTCHCRQSSRGELAH